MNPSLVPIRSTWPTPRGPVLTDARIVKYLKKGFYGKIAQLKQLSRSANKSVRAAALKELIRYEGQPLKNKPSTRRKAVDFNEFI